MTSTTDTFPAQRRPREQEPRAALREAMLDERQAYEEMRSLVPDLALPRGERRPLTAQQQEAIEAYQRQRDRLELLRRLQRSPGLAQVVLRQDQSV